VRLAENWANKRRKRPISDEWKKDAMAFWDEFCKHVRVATANEITEEHIASYGNTILNRHLSSTYVKLRFAAIKTIFRTSKKHPEARRVWDIATDPVGGLIPPADEHTQPTPITPAEFQSLLGACKTRPRWRAILLTALNACYYPSDIANLKKRDIDWEHKRDTEVVSICNLRGKTGYARACCLWPNTVAALREYLDHTPENDSPYVFLNRKGKRFHPLKITQGFNRLRCRAKLGAHVKFRNLRDAAYTYATQEDDQSSDMMLGKAKILAGHQLPGVSSKYIFSNPRHVKSVCDRIYRAFF